jgi:2-dehydro-3-deoxyphosphogluconate aldolase/(4S)-4-hydroxy-2-oxoglutarate aldolase
MDLFVHRIIPVLTLNDSADAAELGQALLDGGLPVVEVTLRTVAAAEAIAIMAEIEGLTIGAGTVLTPAQVELAVEAGAKFLVSPGLRTDVVREAHLAGKPMFPGVATPSEVMQAQALGLDTVKFFPANIYGGARVIRALAAPFTTMRFIPTGGVNTANLAEYLSLACVPVVGGSWMAPAELIAAHDFATITARCREAVQAAAPFRV